MQDSFQVVQSVYIVACVVGAESARAEMGAAPVTSYWARGEFIKTLLFRLLMCSAHGFCLSTFYVEFASRLVTGQSKKSRHYRTIGLWRNVIHQQSQLTSKKPIGPKVRTIVRCQAFVTAIQIVCISFFFFNLFSFFSSFFESFSLFSPVCFTYSLHGPLSRASWNDAVIVTGGSYLRPGGLPRRSPCSHPSEFIFWTSWTLLDMSCNQNSRNKKE